MTEHQTDTIGALATAPIPAGLAVIRVSGSRSRAVIRALFSSKKSPVDHPRELIYGELLDATSGEMIDVALAVYMPGPHSYTGEDVVEFQFHGSPLLIERILRSLFAFGVIPAEPGEFTKRAFLNGKLDLVQAEAVSDLIHATSEASLKLASEALKGKLSTALNDIGTPLREALAEIEASIDFPEEEINPESQLSISKSLSIVRSRINDLVRTYQYGHVVREGFRVLLYGKTNVGKSSLLNALLGKKRAIVTDIAGTTRDTIEEQYSYEGFQFVFCDVAGIRNSKDEVEKIGVALAEDKVNWADVVLFVVDATVSESEWRPLLEDLQKRAKEIWMVVNKVDLNPSAIGTIVCESTICSRNFYISAKTRNGCEALMEALVELVKARMPVQSDGSIVVTNERHRTALIRADESIQKAEQAFEQKLPLEIISGELRIALGSINEIIGKTYTEDILGMIFSKFCIGK